jgi:hypothetical protein
MPLRPSGKYYLCSDLLVGPWLEAFYCAVEYAVRKEIRYMGQCLYRRFERRLGLNLILVAAVVRNQTGHNVAGRGITRCRCRNPRLENGEDAEEAALQQGSCFEQKPDYYCK